MDTKTLGIRWDQRIQEIKEILNTCTCSPRYKKANKRKKKQNHIYSIKELKDLGLTLIEIDNVEYVELERETCGRSTKLKRRYRIKKDYFESLSEKNKKLLINT